MDLLMKNHDTPEKKFRVRIVSVSDRLLQTDNGIMD